ncbi:MAG: hypothetical protein RLO12_16295 [Fulvivirga sp.]
MLSCGKPSANETSKEITKLETDDAYFIQHDFPKTYFTDSVLKAKIYSNSEEWKILRAFNYCKIDDDNVFRIRHRTKVECLEFPVDDNIVQIEFTTIGLGEKDFGTVTLVLENKEGVKKATELEFPYFLIEK